ncbi:MAG: hypothetical protein M3Y27_11615 [Acidobacteriota bacterium]|nr:hypothetical protein [Acidobacteriota bacterium]
MTARYGWRLSWPLRMGRGVVLLDWGGRDLKLGTIRAAVRQLQIDWEEFKKACASPEGF